MLDGIFNTLIDSFTSGRVGIADDFLNRSLALHLKNNLTALYQRNSMKSAGTGNDTLVAHNLLVRSDKIYRLDRAHNDPYENDFFDLMDCFVSYVNRTCYTGITGYEFHYALYEKGSFYKKHLDQFQNNGSRQYSMIMYLNVGWEKNDGGELRIYHQNSFENIEPLNGKSVFFKSSELEHEVMLAHKPRMSITGWLKTSDSRY